jgi:hypothetical protein
MSEDGFHVHGPHDHAVEHEAQHGDASMHVLHRWAQSMTLIQIAIALAAITFLTRNTGLMYVAYSAAGIAITIGVLAGLHI